MPIEFNPSEKQRAFLDLYIASENTKKIISKRALSSDNIIVSVIDIDGREFNYEIDTNGNKL